MLLDIQKPDLCMNDGGGVKFVFAKSLIIKNLNH
jgi:hypothetical protein